MKRITIIAALVLSACVASGVKVTEEQARQFERGRSTYADVVSKLGPPTASVVTATGFRTVSYAFVEAAARPETYIPIAGAFIGGADARSNVATFTFNAQGVLIDYTVATSQAASSLGARPGQQSDTYKRPQ